MKLLLYVSLGFVVTVGATLLMIRGPAPETHPIVMFALVVLFGIPPLGAFWMIYLSIRYERNPLPMVLLALFVPFTFLWFYFEKVRPGKLRKRRNFA